MLEVFGALQAAHASLSAGSFDRTDRRIEVTSGPFLTSPEDVASLVVGVNGGRPVYVSDVAEVIDGPEEAVSTSRIGLPAAITGVLPEIHPAVTLAISKKKGTNAVWVADAVIERFGCMMLNGIRAITVV